MERPGPALPFGSRQLAPPPGRPPRGADVAVFQRLYNALAELLEPPPGPLLVVDGAFGPASASAARLMQRRFGLTVDGVVGPSTYFALGHGVGAHVTYGGPAFGSRTLRPGDAGGDVYVLQNRLAVGGWLQRAGDGLWAEPTGRALAAFRLEAGLPPGAHADGPAAAALQVRTLAGGRALFSGRNGLDVAWAQRRLRRAGRYSGAVDGIWSPETVAAVRAFQGQAGLLADGIVGPDTFLALGRAQP